MSLHNNRYCAWDFTRLHLTFIQDFLSRLNDPINVSISDQKIKMFLFFLFEALHNQYHHIAHSYMDSVEFFFW